MHQHRAEFEIGEDANPSTPPTFPPPPPRLSDHPDSRNFRVQIDSSRRCLEIPSPASPAAKKPAFSTAHKRSSVSSQSPSQAQPSNQGPFKSGYPHRVDFFCSSAPSSPKLCLCPCRLRLLLLMVPFLYFFASNHRLSFPLELIPVIAFLIALFTSLSLALPRLPSIRLFLARSLPSKFAPLSSPKPQSSSPPVVWSIGGDPKLQKSPTSGSWVQVYGDGDVYEGEFHGGKCSGSGVYHYYKSGRYEGDWIDGKYDGYGIETWAKGSKYRGQYRQGLRHGIGTYRFYTGDVYAGEWSNGQCHGCGEHNCADGSTYSGEFKWGVKHGLGHYHFRNGDTYAGEYFADKVHGFGVYQFGNGHRYEGAWHEGRRQGFGMYSFRNGETQLGHWQNGVLEVPSKLSNDTGWPYDVIHTKVLNAVQEARQAAERAYSIAKMDERVNKAVAAANRSANAARVAAVKAVQSRIYHSNTSGDSQIPV